jgi:hypothetical protein
LIRTPFNLGWEFRPKANRFLEMGGRAQAFRSVTLPHDAMIEGERSPAAGGATGFFPGGVYEYRKTFAVPDDHRNKRVTLEFEGVYRDAMVYLNGAFAGQCPSGYSTFAVRADNFLKYGADNEIRVECRAHQDSRWYSGAGIHRSVNLIVGELVHIALDGVRVATPDVDAERAVVEVATIVENEGLTATTTGVLTEIRDAGGGVVASDRTVATVLPGEPATVQQRLYVPDPALWSVDTPALYTAAVTLDQDEERVSFVAEAIAIARERIAGDAETMGVNTMMATIGDILSELGTSETVTRDTTEIFSVLDVAGMNYLETRYEPDRALFPNRIIVGSETHPTRIDALWRLVVGNGHVIGDFTWTGWDYLGEAGIGRTGFADDDTPGGHGVADSYPWLTARAGDIDITGHRRAPSHYREIVFGLRTEPYLAVHRPANHGRRIVAGPWSWPDVVSSWSWDGHEGAPVRVDVYSDADEVELLLDGASLGRAPAGREHRYTAEFDIVYRPGELVAVAYTGGAETGRTRLVSAQGPVLLTVEADRPEIRADHTDLAYVSITLADSDGNLYHGRDRPVTVEVTGPGVLQGLGSARPDTEESFTGGTHTTYDGRALAVVRPIGPGDITVTVSAPECTTATVTVQAAPPEPAR